MDLILSLIGVVITTFSAATSALPIAKPNPTPTPTISGDVIIRSGQYSYAGQTLKYTINLPKNGGPLSGEFSGACSGPITGTFDAGPAKAASGEATATCPVLLNQKLTATYIAHFDFEKGQAYIDWQGNIPYTKGQGSFTIGFEPVN